MTKKWIGNAICDFCKTDCTKEKFFCDSPTKQGPWALQCPKCHEKYGIAVGQKYDGPTKEKICDLQRQEQ